MRARTAQKTRVVLMHRPKLRRTPDSITVVEALIDYAASRGISAPSAAMELIFTNPAFVNFCSIENMKVLP